MPTPTPTTSRRSQCPISISLELFGDRWSLLIIRDLMFKGRSTYKDFADAGECIATNILADRLVRLEDAGLIEHGPHPDDGRKTRYRLTRKGMELAPMLIEMVLWAARHEDTDAPPSTVRAMSKDRKRFEQSLWTDWEAARARSAATRRKR